MPPQRNNLNYILSGVNAPIHPDERAAALQKGTVVLPPTNPKLSNLARGAVDLKIWFQRGLTDYYAMRKYQEKLGQYLKQYEQLVYPFAQNWSGFL